MQWQAGGFIGSAEVAVLLGKRRNTLGYYMTRDGHPVPAARLGAMRLWDAQYIDDLVAGLQPAREWGNRASTR